MELKTFVKRCRQILGQDRGWGDGYICIPEGHPCYGMMHDEIEEKYHIQAYGGLTYSGHSDDMKWPYIPEGKWWIIGFETCHYGDNMSRWPDAESVEWEANCIADELNKLG